jgi:hypothetical protein
MIAISAIVFAIASSTTASVLPFDFFLHQLDDFGPSLPPVFKMQIATSTVFDSQPPQTGLFTIAYGPGDKAIFATNGSMALYRDGKVYAYGGFDKTQCRVAKSARLPFVLPPTTYKSTLFWNGKLAEKYSGTPPGTQAQIDVFVEATTKDLLGFHQFRKMDDSTSYVTSDAKVIFFEPFVRDSEFNIPQLECESVESVEFPSQFMFHH